MYLSIHSAYVFSRLISLPEHCSHVGAALRALGPGPGEIAYVGLRKEKRGALNDIGELDGCGEGMEVISTRVGGLILRDFEMWTEHNCKPYL